MDFGLAAGFIVTMTAIVMAATVLKHWISTRAPAPDTGDRLQEARQIELLATENSGLKGQVSRLEERIAVLERIATDPAERTARAIEDLR